MSLSANTIPRFTLSARFSGTTITNSNGTSLVDIFSASTNGSRVNSILLSNSDASDDKFYLWYSQGASDFPLNFINVPDGAGVDGIQQPVSLLNDTILSFVQYDQNNNIYLDLPPNTILKGKVGTAVSVGTSAFENTTGLTRSIYVNVFAQDY